jgi:5S rRNA maturation endonuclease (ribonuclease M5)
VKKSNFDFARVNILNNMLTYKYEQIFEHFGLKLQKDGKKYFGCCPIHGGDNQAALNIYFGGENVRGYWQCRTKHCELTFKKTFLGFIRGLLSMENGWTSEEEEKKIFSYSDTVDWCSKFLNVKLADIVPNYEEIGKTNFINQIKTIKHQQKIGPEIDRSIVLKKLTIPAHFFQERNFSEEILKKYDVGLCNNPGKDMYQRVVVPVYNDRYKMVACTGRSIHPKCPKCDLYHDPNSDCPKQETYKYSKWKNNFKSTLTDNLYNFYNALPYMKKWGSVILTEGPPDVWKLEELGIRNSVGMFGAELTQEQEILLERAGIYTVIILTDMDQPGKLAAQKLYKKLDRLYKVVRPEYPFKDPGEFKQEYVNEELVPVLKRLKYVYR